MCSSIQHDKALLIHKNYGVTIESIYDSYAIAEDNGKYFIAVLDDKLNICFRHYGSLELVTKCFTNYINTKRFEVSILKSKKLNVIKKKAWKPFVMCKECYDSWFSEKDNERMTSWEDL